MVVGLDAVGGDFVLPDVRPRRVLFVSGGSGITPVMSMLRTMRDEGSDREITFIHYARTPQEACYRDELDAMPGVRVLHGYSRSPEAGDLTGYFGAEHLAGDARPRRRLRLRTARPRRGRPRALPDGELRELRAAGVRRPGRSPPVARVAFADSGVEAVDDGRSLLEQAEAAGLSPQSGCRMGICHTCTRRKTSGAVKNLITGAVSTADEEDVQICVTAPVGDVDLAL